ncbi:flavoprotein NADH-dependent oxidoreductase [Mycena olivaceomarginata]|nr:flavoprotein NADH-dependent oxidoreductase [Mycena olivaceomarginata]
MSVLFTPLQLGSTTISNRIGMSALTRSRSSETVPNDLMLEYYVQRAKGGAGLIVSEGILITRQGTEWPAAPGIWDKSHIDGWKKITDAVHEAGGQMYAQLAHDRRRRIYAPSAISARGGKFRFIPGEPGYAVPTEIPDPTVLIAQFKQAALNAKEAGFDGVERMPPPPCMAPTATSYTNSSTPPPTAAPTNGAAVPKTAPDSRIETLKVLREVWGPDVGLKLSPTGGANDVGMPLDDTIATFGHLLREVDKLGLAYVALVRYNPLRDPEFDGEKRATPHDVVVTYRHFLTTTPIFVNGGVAPAEAELLVGSGRVAGVFFGVPWIAHPDLARRIQWGKALDNKVDLAHLYGAEGVDPALGYLDYRVADLVG